MCVDFHWLHAKKVVNSNEKCYLNNAIDLNETKIAVFSTQDDKDPGHDGYNAKFYKLHWNKYYKFLLKAI